MNIKNIKNQNSSAIIPKILGSFCVIPHDYFTKDIFNETRFGRFERENSRTLVTVRRPNGTSLWAVQSDK